MSSVNERFVAAYLLLVGLPLLGLAGVLKTGRTIVAPISVNGMWKLEIENSPLTSQPCQTVITSLQHSAIAISQSGRQLAINFGGDSRMTASGTINDRDLTADIATAPSAAEAQCATDGGLRLAATLDPKATGVLIGTLSVNGCPSCSPVKFRAELQTANPRRQAR